MKLRDAVALALVENPDLVVVEHQSGTTQGLDEWVKKTERECPNQAARGWEFVEGRGGMLKLVSGVSGWTTFYLLH